MVTVTEFVSSSTVCVYTDTASLQDDKVAASDCEVQRESVRFVSTRTLSRNASSNLGI